jgi:hypothetical protein
LPPLADWLNEQGADVIRDPTPWSDRVTYASLKLWRAIKWRLYAKRVKRCA